MSLLTSSNASLSCFMMSLKASACSISVLFNSEELVEADSFNVDYALRKAMSTSAVSLDITAL